MLRQLFFGLIICCMAFGCSFKEYNDQVERMDNKRFEAFGDAMSKQTNEGGRLAVSLMYALNIGHQNLARPETVKDYIIPVANVLNPWMMLWWGGRADENNGGNMSAGRDIYVQSTRSTDVTDSLYSEVMGDNNTTTQYVCPTCGEGDEGGPSTEGGPDVELEKCLATPPGGFNGSTPLFSNNPSCSCSSHFSGQC